jgi:hypothetical protein
MTSVCFTNWKLPRVRVTQLSSCGIPVTGCSTVVTDGIISIAETKEYEARQEFFVKNGDGNFCVQKTNPPILKWLNLVITFCNVDPELVNILTAEPLVSDDAPTPRHTGFSTQVGSASSSNFALEGWTRLGDSSLPCSGSEYGYVLYPFVIEGTVGDVTYENNAASFIVNARTSAGSGWGTGPYFVDKSDATATLDNSIALLTPILSTQHRRLFVTRLAPPAASCGCTTLSSLTPS